MKSYIFILTCIALVFIQCKNESAVTPPKAANGAVSELINNPATADLPTDLDKLARITFEELEYNFGDIKEGEVVSHRFKFINTGKVPLTILRATSSCGCTVPEWPEDPIPPGGSGELTAKFNSDGRTGEQKKLIKVEANTYPNETNLKIISNVIPKKGK
jgi:hypothetical protein